MIAYLKEIEMKKAATLLISREDMLDAMTSWLNNKVMQEPHKIVGFVDNAGGTVLIEIEPIVPKFQLESQLESCTAAVTSWTDPRI
jgi:hypothetical protein